MADQDTSQPAQSRGERFDELSGGGRGADSVSFDPQRDGDDLEQDEREQDARGRSEAEEEVPPS